MSDLRKESIKFILGADKVNRIELSFHGCTCTGLNESFHLNTAQIPWQQLLVSWQ